MERHMRSLSSAGVNFLDPLLPRHEEAVSGPAHELDEQSNGSSVPPDPLARRAYSLAEAARIFGLTARTLRWWAATGRIRTVQIGQKRFVSDMEIHRLLTGGAPPEVAQDHGQSQ
jgi:Helix-turn-helix domain